MKETFNFKSIRLMAYCLVVPGIFLFSSCTSSVDAPMIESPNEAAEDAPAILLSVPDFEYEVMTRTSISTGMVFSWAEGDQIGIYSGQGSVCNFSIHSIGENASTATFDGGGFSLTSGSTYYAVFPYNGNATDLTKVPVTYPTQRQTANDNTEHLGALDYMTSCAVAEAQNQASFAFKHVGAIMRFQLTLPEAGTYTKLTVTSLGDTKFTTEGTIDVSKHQVATAESAAVPPSVSAVTTNSSMSLQLGAADDSGITLESSNLTLIAYMMVAPIDLSSTSVSICVYNNDGVPYSATIDEGKNLAAGKACNHVATLTKHEYVDLDLPSGLLWATCNIGATEALDAGSYFAWGETETKSTYDLVNYSFFKGKGLYNVYLKYVTDSRYGTVDNLSTLQSEDDAASVNWGSPWRMPTSSEITELVENCYWEYVNDNTSKYYKVSSKTHTDKYILLPIVGYYSGSKNASDSRVYYLSRSLSLDNNNNVYSLYLGTNNHELLNSTTRYYGNPVRPVLPKQ